MYGMKGIFQKVEEIVSPVYLVGGSVRDTLMGTEPKDYDFSTPHTPDTIEKRIREAGKKPFLLGKRFGTVGMKINDFTVEITTFRVEKYQRGTRKPEVEFVNDITADLSRRDFTMNAIAMRNDRIIDPCCGQNDIQGKLIRSVGNATVRFKEDPLRMLRAVRFAGQFGFSIEEKTFRSIVKSSHRILEVSKERWMSEIDRLLLSPCVEEGLRQLMDSGLLRFIIPELALQKDYDQNSNYHAHSLWEHTLRVTRHIEPDITLRWAALLHDIAKPFVRIDKKDRSIYTKHDILGHEMVMRLGGHLKWSNRRTRSVAALVRHHLSDNSPLREADNAEKKCL